MTKSVPIDARPAGARRPDPDAWVGTGSAAPRAPKPRRFTFDLDPEVHARFKADCALRGVRMADELRAMIRARVGGT